MKGLELWRIPMNLGQENELGFVGKVDWVDQMVEWDGPEGGYQK